MLSVIGADLTDDLYLNFFFCLKLLVVAGKLAGIKYYHFDGNLFMICVFGDILLIRFHGEHHF